MAAKRTPKPVKVVDDAMKKVADAEADRVAGIVGALQLLLGGESGDDKAAYLHAAFPGLIIGPDKNVLMDRFISMGTQLNDVLGTIDGSSGLGAMAAQSANAQLRALYTKLDNLADFFELHLPSRIPPTYKPRKENWIK